MDGAANSGPCNLSLIPLGENKENKQKQAGVGPYLKNSKYGLNPFVQIKSASPLA